MVRIVNVLGPKVEIPRYRNVRLKNGLDTKTRPRFCSRTGPTDNNDSKVDERTDHPWIDPKDPKADGNISPKSIDMLVS